MVKNLPAVQQTRVRSLGQEDPLEESTATHSSIFAWRIPGTEEPGRLYSIELHRVRHDGSDLAHTTLKLQRKAKDPEQQQQQQKS